MDARPYARHALPEDPIWLRTAFDEVGTEEVTGEVHNPRILGYHACTGLGASDDETPWCASFVCWVMTQCQITSTRSASSLSYLRWGREMSKPVRGCVVIFERRDKQGNVIPNRGHVGFWLGMRGGVTYTLGGNQSDKVGVNAYPTNKVIGYRWPSLPHNSSTNIVSTGVGIGTVAASAPSVMSLISAVGDADSEVGKVVGTAQTLASGLGLPMTNVLALAGVALALAGLFYIVSERNKKIKKFGI